MGSREGLMVEQRAFGIRLVIDGCGREERTRIFRRGESTRELRLDV